MLPGFSSDCRRDPSKPAWKIRYYTNTDISAVTKLTKNRAALPWNAAKPCGVECGAGGLVACERMD